MKLNSSLGIVALCSRIAGSFYTILHNILSNNFSLQQSPKQFPIRHLQTRTEYVLANSYRTNLLKTL